MTDRPRAIVELLPEKVRVGGFDIRIEKWSVAQVMGARSWGQWSMSEQCISVQLDMPTVFKAVDTVLHEITHAIFWAYSIGEDNKEERTVSTLAAAWLQVYRDNPWLLTWLQRALTT